MTNYFIKGTGRKVKMGDVIDFIDDEKDGKGRVTGSKRVICKLDKDTVGLLLKDGVIEAKETADKKPEPQTKEDPELTDKYILETFDAIATNLAISAGFEDAFKKRLDILEERIRRIEEKHGHKSRHAKPSVNPFNTSTFLGEDYDIDTISMTMRF